MQYGFPVQPRTFTNAVRVRAQCKDKHKNLDAIMSGRGRNNRQHSARGSVSASWCQNEVVIENTGRNGDEHHGCFANLSVFIRKLREKLSLGQVKPKKLW